MRSGSDFLLLHLVWIGIGMFCLQFAGWHMLMLLNNTARKRIVLLIAPITHTVAGIILFSVAYATLRRANPLFEEYLYGPLYLLQFIGVCLFLTGINKAVRKSSSKGTESPLVTEVLRFVPNED